MSTTNATSRTQWSRKTFSRISLVTAIVLAAGGVTAAVMVKGESAPPQGRATELTLLFQGAVHGKIDECGCKSRSLGGLAARAHVIEEVRRRADHVLLVDAGNLAGAPGEAMRRQSRFLAQETAALGYRVAGIGPWDLGHGADFLRELDATTDLSFTSANVVRGGEPLFSPYEILEEADVRVGLISVCGGDLLSASGGGKATAAADWEIQPAETALARWLPQVEAKSDVVILLANLPREERTRLLSKLEGAGIDFVIDGYENVHRERPERVGSTTVLAANSQGKYLGQLDLALENGRIRDHRLTVHAVDPEVGRSGDVAQRVRGFQETAEDLARR